MAGNNIEVARAVVTIVPTMEGAQQTITSELTQAASSSAVSDAGNTAGSNFVAGLGKGLALAGAATAVVTAATVKSAEAFVSAASDVAEYGDNIDKMSQKMGISAEAYQEWDFVMQHCGTSMETLKASMKTLASAAETGSEAFEQLGISQEEIANMSQEELFDKTIAALQNVEDETQRTYLAGQLLGRGATELGALLNMSADETEEMRKELHDLGGVMSDEAVKASAEFQDSLQNMQTAAAGLKNNLMSQFLPGMSSVMDGLSKVLSGDSTGLEQITAGIDNVVSQMTEQLPKFLELGMNIVQSLAQAIMDNLPALADAALQLLGSFVSFFLENLPTLIEVGLNMLLTIADGIIANLPVIIPALVDVILTIVEKLTDPDTVVKLLEASLQIIIALAEGIINALPKLIEKAPIIIANLLEALVRAIPVLLEAAASIITTLGEGIVNGLTAVAQWGADIIDTIKTAIMEKIEEAKTWGKDLIQNFVDGIKGALNLVGDAVKAVAQKIKDFIGFSEPEEGPLSNFHTYAPDMIDLFTEGLEDSKVKLQSTLTSVLQLPENEMQVEAAGVGAAPLPINVYIGQEKLDTIIVNAQSRYNLMSGGR